MHPLVDVVTMLPMGDGDGFDLSFFAVDLQSGLDFEASDERAGARFDPVTVDRVRRRLDEIDEARLRAELRSRETFVD